MTLNLASGSRDSIDLLIEGKFRSEKLYVKKEQGMYIQITYDMEAKVWVGICNKIGLALEDSSFEKLLQRIAVAAPELRELNGILSPDELYKELEEARACYERGEYEDFDTALDGIMKKYGLDVQSKEKSAEELYTLYLRLEKENNEKLCSLIEQIPEFEEYVKRNDYTVWQRIHYDKMSQEELHRFLTEEKVKEPDKNEAMKALKELEGCCRGFTQSLEEIKKRRLEERYGCDSVKPVKPSLLCIVYDRDAYIRGIVTKLDEKSFEVLWGNKVTGSVDYLDESIEIIGSIEDYLCQDSIVRTEMRKTSKMQQQYIKEVQAEMRHRSLTSDEISKIISKTGFLSALERYPEVQLHYDVRDAVDEILLMAAKSNEGNKMESFIKAVDMFSPDFMEHGREKQTKEEKNDGIRGLEAISSDYQKDKLISEKMAGFFIGALLLGYDYDEAWDLLLNSKQGKGILDNNYIDSVNLQGVVSARKADDEHGSKYNKNHQIMPDIATMELLADFINRAHKRFGIEYSEIFNKISLNDFMSKYGIVLGDYDDKLIKAYIL